eukprot:876245_1
MDTLQKDDGKEEESSSPFNFAKLGSMAKDVTGRLQKISAEDLGSVIGVDARFTQRELKVAQSILSGEGLFHHMEDKYYQGMGMCAGFAALPGEDLTPLEELENMEIGDIKNAIIRSESA